MLAHLKKGQIHNTLILQGKGAAKGCRSIHMKRKPAQESDQLIEADPLWAQGRFSCNRCGKSFKRVDTI